ncbi:ciliary microtubule inner protein 2A [Strix uralensis]|uniref:ciliary microtubule inner protein 2A n=1 Tax=Strix uralensis TaxID=36305 RepID=UPI003DA7108A
MAAPKENNLFPRNPYYIPGYEGFVPQYKYQFGKTFGKTTYNLLMDPGVAKSPCPLLAPLHNQKFTEDFGRRKDGVQGYLPERPGHFPYEKPGAAPSFPEPVLGPKSPPPGPGPAKEELTMMRTDPLPQHHPGEYAPRTQLPQGYPQRISHRPASEGKERRLPEITPAYGQGKRCRPSWLSGDLVGSKLPVKIEGVTLPEYAETADTEQDYRLPKLEVPCVIQQKVIPGYAGFIPCLTQVNGVNYVQAVKEATNEFDRRQMMDRNPACSAGKRFPQTYWPNNRIYTSDGLIPSYAGFIPDLRHTYGLTFRNSTRKAYEKEQRRRACAL